MNGVLFRITNCALSIGMSSPGRSISGVDCGDLAVNLLGDSGTLGAGTCMSSSEVVSGKLNATCSCGEGSNTDPLLQT